MKATCATVVTLAAACLATYFISVYDFFRLVPPVRVATLLSF